MQQNDAVIDNDSVIVCYGTDNTTIVPQNVTKSNLHVQNDVLSPENAITITQSEENDNTNVCYSPSWNLLVDSDEHFNPIGDTNHNIDDDVSPLILPTSLKFDRSTMSISVKRCTNKTTRSAHRFESSLTKSDLIEDENIECSAIFDPSESMDTNHSIQSESNNAQRKRDRFNFDTRNLNDNYKRLYHSLGTDKDVEDESMNKELPNDRLVEILRRKDPLRNAVVLRSPRGNQPRTYTTDALYSALMDVKSGESIYR